MNRYFFIRMLALVAILELKGMEVRSVSAGPEFPSRPKKYEWCFGYDRHVAMCKVLQWELHDVLATMRSIQACEEQKSPILGADLVWDDLKLRLRKANKCLFLLHLGGVLQ